MIPNPLTLLSLAWAALTLNAVGLACVLLDAPFPVSLTLLTAPLLIVVVMLMLLFKPQEGRHEHA